MEGGVLGKSGFEEIVASTYTGWCFGLTSEATDNNITSSSRMSAAASDSVAISDGTREKVHRLRNEIEALQQKVAAEREQYQAASQSASASATQMVSAIPKLNINDRFTLGQADASYNLSLEVQTAIDNVLLQSDVPIDLLDVEKNSAVVSYSACDPDVRSIRDETRAQIALSTGLRFMAVLVPLDPPL